MTDIDKVTDHKAIPTPRTDAVAFTIEKRGLNNVWTVELVHASEARQLERELAEAIERCAKVEADSARYRWLVSMAWGVPLGDGLHDLTFRTFLHEGPWLDSQRVADAAIDKAMGGNPLLRAVQSERPGADGRES